MTEGSLNRLIENGKIILLEGEKNEETVLPPYDPPPPLL